MTLHVFICRRRLDKHVISILSFIQFLHCQLLLLLFFYPLSLPLFHLYTLLFPHTGSLIQVPMSEKGKITRGRLGSLSLKKEGERQCFLFSKHLIICTRGSGGKLHLTKVCLCCWASSWAAPHFKHHNLTAPQKTLNLWANLNGLTEMKATGLAMSWLLSVAMTAGATHTHTSLQTHKPAHTHTQAHMFQSSCLMSLWCVMEWWCIITPHYSTLQRKIVVWGPRWDQKAFNWRPYIKLQ